MKQNSQRFCFLSLRLEPGSFACGFKTALISDSEHASLQRVNVCLNLIIPSLQLSQRMRAETQRSPIILLEIVNMLEARGVHWSFIN